MGMFKTQSSTVERLEAFADISTGSDVDLKKKLLNVIKRIGRKEHRKVDDILQKNQQGRGE